MEEVGSIKEPLFGYEQRVVVVPIERLGVIEVQRRPSAFHVRRLTESMRKVGFVTPLVAFQRGAEFVVIDGQQRLLAAKELGIKALPCVLVPERYAHQLMELNVEKSMSLREKAYVALNVYRWYLSEDPGMGESDPRLADSIEFAHHVTLGLGYEKNPRLFGSAYEPILRKVDGFLPLPLGQAIERRESRAGAVLEADELARRAVERLEEVGVSHPFIHREVVAFCDPIKRKREVTEEFGVVFERLKDKLRELIERPTLMRGVGVE